MKRPEPVTILLLIAISIPVLIELRTVFGFFGVDLPIYGLLGIGLAYLGALGLWVLLGEEPANASGT